MRGHRQFAGSRTPAADRLHRKAQQHAAMMRLQESEGGVLDGDIVDTSRNKEGARFRTWFYVAIVVVFVALLAAKLAGETMVVGEAVPTADTAARPGETVADRALRLKEEIQIAADAARAAHDAFATPECGDLCRHSAIALRERVDQLSSVLPTDYTDVIGVGGTTLLHLSRAEVEARYQKVKRLLEQGDSSVRHISPEEVEEARRVLLDPEARRFAVMFPGVRVPGFMSDGSARASTPPGGVQIVTGAFKWRKLLALLDFLGNPDLGVAVLAVIVVLQVMPVVHNFRQLLRTMRHAFPDLDPEEAEAYHNRMAAARRETVTRRR